MIADISHFRNRRRSSSRGCALPRLRFADRRYSAQAEVFVQGPHLDTSAARV